MMEDYSDEELLQIMECAQKPPEKQASSEEEEDKEFDENYNFMIPSTPSQLPAPRNTSTPSRPPIPIEPIIQVVKNKPLPPPDQDDTISIQDRTPEPQPPPSPFTAPTAIMDLTKEAEDIIDLTQESDEEDTKTKMPPPKPKKQTKLQRYQPKNKKVASVLSRAFSFTINTNIDVNHERFQQINPNQHKIEYLYYQEEVGQKEGRTHLQGFVKFSQQKRLLGARNVLGPNAYIQACTVEEAAKNMLKKKRQNSLQEKHLK